jgi:phosphoribosylformylglycinamidine synthase
MKARIFVTLKKSVLDPQGKTVQAALDTLGFDKISDVRCGKMIELSFPAGVAKESAEKDLKEMCEKLLANTVIEDYKWELN